MNQHARRRFRRMKAIIRVAILLAAVAAVVAVQDLASSATARPSRPSTDAVVPRAGVVRRLALGHATAASDVYWLRFISYLGSDQAVRDGGSLLYPLGTLITDLDPRFAYAHEAAGLALNEFKRFEEAQAILDAGVRRNPGRWQTPFYAGFNAWDGLRQYERGAELFLRAARVPGGPAYLADLAARLFARSDAVGQGIALLDAMLADPGLTPSVREELQLRRQALEVEGFIRRVEERVDLFRIRNGRNPVSLAECGVSPDGPLVVPEGLELGLDARGVVTVEGFERPRLHEPGSSSPRKHRADHR